MIGLLPCAGTAERFNGLPKYLLPCPGGMLLSCHSKAMHSSCETVLLGCREDSQDLITDYCHDAITYIPEHCETMTQTVKYASMQASATLNDRVNNGTVLFGMPDTFFDFPLVYERLAARLNASQADVVLAVFKARPDQHKEGGMVNVSHNQVVDIVDKPEATSLQYIWGAMAWRARFWSCLTPDTPHVGYGVKAAIEQGLDVQAVICAGDYWDCGTPERYFAMIKANT